MTQQHTPGPWTYERLQPYMKGCAIGTGNLAIPTASTLIATAWNTTKGLSGPQDAETEANARFIVQACNAHDELLAALKECMSLVGEDNLPEDVNDILDRALAASAKATSPQAQ